MQNETPILPEIEEIPKEFIFKVLTSNQKLMLQKYFAINNEIKNRPENMKKKDFFYLLAAKYSTSYETILRIDYSRL